MGTYQGKEQGRVTQDGSADGERVTGGRRFNDRIRGGDMATGHNDELTDLEGSGRGFYSFSGSVQVSSGDTEGPTQMMNLVDLLQHEQDDATLRRPRDVGALWTTIDGNGGGGFDIFQGTQTTIGVDSEVLHDRVLQLRGGGNAGRDGFVQFAAILKNVRSIQTEARFEEFLHECGDFTWDVVLVNETWRKEGEEILKLDTGHCWLGSGGSEGKHGVGALLRRGMILQRFVAISPRLCYVEADDAHQKYSIIVAYMPHGGYADPDIEGMYKQISELIKRAKKARRFIIIAGDWNAEVQSAERDGKHNSVGAFANSEGNARGEWLTSWACHENLLITNTMFKKRWGHIWTHEQKGRTRQLDYIMVEKKRAAAVLDAFATTQLHLGSDHRAVRLELSVGKAATKKRKHFKQRNAGSNVGWKPKDAYAYKSMLDSKIADIVRGDRLEGKSRSIDEQLQSLEHVVVQTSALCKKVDAVIQTSKTAEKEALQELIAKRRSLDPGPGMRQRRLEVSKLIQKHIKMTLRQDKKQQIAKALDEFKGLKHLGSIRSSGRKQLLRSAFDKNGLLQHGRQEIVDVFADFYGDLYAAQKVGATAEESWRSGPCDAVPEFTMEEIRQELKQMSKNKAADSTGLVIEMLQEGSDLLMQTILDIFNQLLKPAPETPTAWKESRVIVLFKKGDPRQADNYRPITLLSIMYKLFSRMLNKRMKHVLDAAQPPDQAGFREGFGVEDHLFTMALLIEASVEFNVPLWACAVDFRKAFDTVSHGLLWEALADQGVPKAYIRILAKLYENQVGRIVADRTSKEYKIRRGTKQGDPMSPKLFNAVLEKAVGSIQKEWRKKGFGICFGDNNEDRLCTLRFADDLILLASSKNQLKKMLCDLSVAARGVGLELHFGKTKVLTTLETTGSVEVDGTHVKIVQTTEYLGRLLSCHDLHTVEIASRIKKAWKKFMSLKHQLCSRDYPLKQRLRLFDSTVTSVVLYGSCAWTMTADLERKLRTTQRRMLRWMVGVRRRPKEETSDTDDSTTTTDEGEERSDDDSAEDIYGESWVDWIRRATNIAEEHLKNTRLEDWVCGQRKRLFRWAGHVARRSDGRWSYRLLGWRPIGGKRTVGHPRRRWADVLNEHFAKEHGLEPGSWELIAQDRATWASLEYDFSKRE